ncbi:kinetochore scaffold 1 isoform X3 [Oryzias melastigma]|uniref:Kinetochore scaffold 1-like n=3 Tax=Oryzias melastigma TaxID=30732 RepID=A0A3B3B5Z3_ORYME|nr:kinetochore scaffold 1 isoform X3 [Oryzias melastigma]
MEPQDSEKHNEGSGFRKRSISSILKAPRKSIILRDLEQQENEVESTKPVEKRNSRRVSFAPANDVLLFANDVKSASPVRNPLQELTAPTVVSTQNRAQADPKAENSQQISGIENLLKAPLHVPLQTNTVDPDVWNEIGEKTMVFSSEDAVMDMTHSHTINISGDADLLGETYLSDRIVEAGLPDLSVNMMTSRSTDFSGQKGSLSAVASSLDPGFEDFLASLSQQSNSSAGTAFAGPPRQSFGNVVGLSKTQRVEKQLPGLENSKKKLSVGFGGSMACPEVGMSAEEFLTEPQTGHSLGARDKDDLFQCLFPTLDMFAEKKGASQQTNRDMHSASPLRQKHGVSSAAKGQKTLTFPAEDDMDITHTVDASSTSSAKMQTGSSDPSLINHQSKSSDPSLCISEGGWPGKKSSAEPGGVDPEGDVSMEMTEVQTGRIEGLSDSQDPFQFLIPSQEEVFPPSRSQNRADAASGQENIKGSSSNRGVQTSLKPQSSHRCQSRVGLDDGEKTIEFAADDDCMDITQSYTANISSSESKQLFSDLGGHEDKTVTFTLTDPAKEETRSRTVSSGFQNTILQSNEALPSNKDRTVRFTANDVVMDITKSHTVNISSGFAPTFLQDTKVLPSNGERTVRFTANDAVMDITKSHTVNISSGFQKSIVQDTEALPSNKDRTVRFTANDAGMDITKSHTVNISSGFQKTIFQDTEALPSNKDRTVRFTTNDAVMEITKSHTVNISSGFQETIVQDTEALPSNKDRTMRFTANDAVMDITKSHTVQPTCFKNTEALPSNGEKTTRFTTSDAAMDMTKSHTVNISSGFQPAFLQNTEVLPSNKDRTMRFTANDAAMDVTKSHTVNISSGFQPTCHKKNETIVSNGEKTTRFTTSDAAMDVTKSHTVNIDADLKLIQLQSVESIPTNTDKTQMYDVKEADVTKANTVNTAANLKVLSQSALDVTKEEKPFMPTTTHEAVNVSRFEGISTSFEPSKDASPSKGDKTVRFTLCDAAMDVTKSHTVNIDADLDAMQQQDVEFLPKTADSARNHSVLIAPDTHVLPRLTHSDKVKSFRSIAADKAASGMKSFTANISTHLEPVSGQSVETLLMHDTAMDKTQTLSANIASNLPSDVMFQQNKTLSLHACKPELDLKQKLNKSMSQDSFPVDNLKTKTMKPLEILEPNSCPSDQKPELFLDKSSADCPQIFEGLDIRRDQTYNTVGQTSAEIQTRSVFASQDHKVSLESEEVPNPQESITPSQPELMKELEPATLGSLERESPSVDEHGTLKSPKSRRKSLADLQTKVRRLSHLINVAPDAVAIEMCTSPLPQTDHDLYKNTSDATPAAELQLQMASKTETEGQGLCHPEGEQPVATATADATPFRCKTKQLISRLSVGGFKPKLPHRNCPEDPNKVASTKNVCVINELNNPQEEISNIYDEELDSCEDMSEIIDTRSPERISEKSPPEEFIVDPLENDEFEEERQGLKRPLTENEDDREDEKRLKASSEFELMSEVGEQDVSRTRTATHTSDSSSRCEAAFDSTIKNSLFESQLEDSFSDAQKRLEDGTITVSEFFKLFNIDFVIHNPRQSVLPSRLLSETEMTTMDCLKNRHISRPKQRVYEADIQNLSQEVQRLQVRMWDLQKPLSRVNAPLWEQIRLFSEKELKAFGAQLKARSNFFRKQSKVQSHLMKEVLYSNLIAAHREEQQTLRGRLEQADQMMESLDGCIAELEAELAKVEEAGSEDKPSVKSLQEEVEKVTEALADGERLVAELETQKQQNLKQVLKLKEETEKLQTHMDMLDTVNEWRLKETSQTVSIYSFLHDTVSLQLIFSDSDGSDPEAAAEQRLKDIVFRLNLDDERSHDHARLVHTLVSQFVAGESAWLEKYPTRREVPKLLHDVSLAVSRCRLLGEELRLLKMWGAMRLQILSLTCTDTRVHVVFSSLKTFSKFKVVFSVSLAGLVYDLKVESFQSIIGKTSIQQIDDIVASVSPSRNLLTKICRKIHQTLLC